MLIYTCSKQTWHKPLLVRVKLDNTLLPKANRLSFTVS